MTVPEVPAPAGREPSPEDVPEAPQASEVPEAAAGGPKAASPAPRHQAAAPAPVKTFLQETLERIEARQKDAEERQAQGAALLEQVGERLAEIGRLGVRNADLIDRLHADNQALRGGELAQAQAPLVRDLIRLHDDICRLEAATPEGRDPSSDLGIVRGQLVSALDRAGITESQAVPGDVFDPRLHHGMARVPTAKPALVGTIEKVVRIGFKRDSGQIVRPAEVEVYVAQSIPEAEPSPVALPEQPSMAPSQPPTSEAETPMLSERPARTPDALFGSDAADAGTPPLGPDARHHDQEQ